MQVANLGEKMEIRTVLERKDGVKMVIIPKGSDMKKGDTVVVNKVKVSVKKI